MPVQSSEPSKSPYGLRVLNARSMRSHNAHVRGGRAYVSKGCSFCKSGLDGVAPKLEEKKPESGVVQDNRVDGERDAASSFARWWSGNEGDKLQEEEGEVN